MRSGDEREKNTFATNGYVLPMVEMVIPNQGNFCDMSGCVGRLAQRKANKQERVLEVQEE